MIENLISARQMGKAGAHDALAALLPTTAPTGRGGGCFRSRRPEVDPERERPSSGRRTADTPAGPTRKRRLINMAHVALLRAEVLRIESAAAPTPPQLPDANGCHFSTIPGVGWGTFANGPTTAEVFSTRPLPSIISCGIPFSNVAILENPVRHDREMWMTLYGEDSENLFSADRYHDTITLR
jgi:hypothetical protein